MSTTRGRRQPARFNPFLATMLVIVAVLGSLITLEALGKTDLGIARLWGGNEVKANMNMVPVLIATQRAQPGDAVGSAHVWDAQAKVQKRVPMSRSVVLDKHYATGLSQIRGRVLATFKQAGEPFVPDDFLPEGTKPGLGGLVPEGMELVFLSNDRFIGLGQLRYQDRFDLLMTVPVDEEIAKAAQESLESRSRISPSDRIRLAASKPAPEHRLVAQYGLVIRSGIEAGRDTQTAVALHSDDVQAALDAQSGDLDIYCKVRSAAKEGTDEPERIAQAPYDPTSAYEWVVEDVAEVEVYQGRDSKLNTARKSVRAD